MNLKMVYLNENVTKALINFGVSNKWVKFE